MSHVPSELVRERAVMLSAARNYLEALGCCEVDVPILGSNAPIDAHIDLIAVADGRWLYSSPEYGMKRLLCKGVGDIYQISHVFRRGEEGPLHRTEFTMAEWYRIAIAFDAMIEETLGFLRLFLGDCAAEVHSYRHLFQHHVGEDPFTASDEQLALLLHNHGISGYCGIEKEGRDAYLNLLWGAVVEPALDPSGKKLQVVVDYPVSQAALARCGYSKRSDAQVAMRYEVYYRGVELANGYHELADAHEQRRRLVASNCLRKAMGKEVLPLDEPFLAALEDEGLPDCCGVAVGFDRLLMLRAGAVTLAQLDPLHLKDN